MGPYFHNDGYYPTEYFCRSGSNIRADYSTTFGDGGSGIPQHGLVDRDGNVRKYSVGATDGEPYKTEWDDAIEELL
ncbi:hypothetical protein J7J84_03645 [bacterium]|nr:hypothetical protein [bacterium]